MSEGPQPENVGVATAAPGGWVFVEDDKFLRGKSGRLFLANDANRVLSQHAGEVLFTEEQLAAWRRTLESRAAWLAHTVGASYMLLVPPNAHSVYPEDLPDDVHSAARRPIHQLLSHLEETGSFARVVYPLDDMLAAKAGELPVYPRTNTHWTDYGQYLAYGRVMEEVRARVAVDEVPRSEVQFRTVEETGDLGFKTRPRETSPHVWVEVPLGGARLVYDNCVRNSGAIVVTESDADTEARCLVVGDSYSYGMLPFLAPVFRRLVFAHTSSLDFELALEERPDVVISVLNERFMIIPPNDIFSPTTREVAAWKLETGILRPRSVAWPEAAAET